MLSQLSLLLCLSVAFAAQYPAHTNFGYQGYQGYQGGYQGAYQGGYQGAYQGGYSRNVVPIVAQDFQIAPDGSSYKFNYQSGDGTSRQEAGVQKGPESYSVTGSFGYSLPNGAPVQVNFVSDEFGYQPSGSGVHPDIAKAVAEQVAEARSSPHGGYSGSGFGGSYLAPGFGGAGYGGYKPVYG